MGWFTVCDCGINQTHFFSNVAVNGHYGKGSVMVGIGMSTNGKKALCVIKNGRQ